MSDKPKPSLVMITARITKRQAAFLQNRADKGGVTNLSSALREVIEDAMRRELGGES